MAVEKEGLRIAVVDDEEMILNVFASLMRQYKYHADFFESPQQAFQSIQTHPDRYDLLITDIHMPEENGVDFAKRVRTVSPGLPIMFMTGQETAEIKSEALKLGRVSFLSKPFSLVTILEQVISNFISDN